MTYHSKTGATMDTPDRFCDMVLQDLIDTGLLSIEDLEPEKVAAFRHLLTVHLRMHKLRIPKLYRVESISDA